MSRHHRVNVLLALLVPVIVIVAVVVTLNATSDDTGTAAAGGKNGIAIKDFEFHPATLTVGAGTNVTVTNSDGAKHTLTSDQKGAFDTGDLDGGKTATITPKKPGTFAYHCEIHDYMTGTLKVTG